MITIFVSFSCWGPRLNVCVDQRLSWSRWQLCSANIRWPLLASFGIRERQASKESSAEPDAIRSMFLLLEAPTVGAADPVLMDEFVEVIDGPDVDFISVVGLDELMEEPDEGFVSSLAQPAVSRAMNAIMPAILAITGLISHSSVLR
jgi:hypothetical protein